VRLAVFDVDGVLTDGRLFLGADGSEYKTFHTRDGQGLGMLREGGIRIAVISGRSSPAVARRMAELGIRHVFQGQEAKLQVFEDLLDQLQLHAEQSAFLGDDLPDLPVMQRAGLAAAVADAHPLVREHAHWQSICLGGLGAVREFCELLLDAQGTLQAQVDRYLLSPTDRQAR
jgi:3-deoxy-D-manno-octulosonate 8-phosphate phosphatase (KDO 8-P phosphatase)